MIIKLIKLILTKLENIPIKDIIFDNIDMKTGYICDIKSLTLVLNNDDENVVLKIENYDNELSSVARKINLYNNEVKFYEKISNIVDIKAPKFYCSLVIDNKKSISIRKSQ